jgi:peptidoglycan/xylan/chitin deacetylase (PgdA/CDA1 family)
MIIVLIGYSTKSANSFCKYMVRRSSLYKASIKGILGSDNIQIKSLALKRQNKPNYIPVLMYHCIGDNSSDAKELYVTPLEFKKQLKYLKDAGYTPIDFKQADNTKSIIRPVIITFDDGYKDNYTNAYPLLKEFNFKATIFLISSAIGKKQCLDISNIKEMRDLVDFQGHSVTHPHLAEIELDKVDYELRESQKAIENITGKPVFVFAYPYGSYNQNVINIVKKYYKYALTTNRGIFYANTPSAHEIKRIAVFRSTSMKLFIDRLESR